MLQLLHFGSDMSRFPPAGPIVLGLIVIRACLLAPLAEELLFRGALFGWLRDRLSAGLTILLTAALFAGIAPAPPRHVPVRRRCGLGAGADRLHAALLRHSRSEQRPDAGCCLRAGRGGSGVMSGASHSEVHRLSEEAITVNAKPTAARKKRLPPRLRRPAASARLLVSGGAACTKIRILCTKRVKAQGLPVKS